MAVNNGHEARLIRIAHVAPQLATGGLEKLLVEFARHADRGRFELRFIALAERGGPADEIEACGWPVTALCEPPGLRPLLVLRLAGLLRSWGADVVHTHNTKPLIYAGPAARLAGVRRVIHTRHGQRFNSGAPNTSLFRLAARSADRLVCVSHDSARLSVEERLDPRKVMTVWNGIDVSRFSYVGPADGGPVVAVGRLSPEKGGETLIRAAAIVARDCPDFRLELAGGGTCLADLTALAASLGLGDHVTFLGEVRDVPAVLARASAYVLPSFTEGVSLTLLEAMARGLPVVATRVGGNPEVLDGGDSGLLVPAGSPPELAAAILRVLSDPGEARRLGLGGRRRVEQFFDVRRMVHDYERLYLGGGAEPSGRLGDAAANPVTLSQAGS